MIMSPLTACEPDQVSMESMYPELVAFWADTEEAGATRATIVESIRMSTNALLFITGRSIMIALEPSIDITLGGIWVLPIVSRGFHCVTPCHGIQNAISRPSVVSDLVIYWFGTLCEGLLDMKYTIIPPNRKVCETLFSKIL